MTTDTPRAPRRNGSFWQQHIEQWKLSGLSKIAYSEQHDLKPASFYHWSKKLENIGLELQPCAPTSPAFVPVQIDHGVANITKTTQFVHVERAATEIALPIDLNDDQIQHWLQAIHALHV